jgi:hypothetical protein
MVRIRTKGKGEWRNMLTDVKAIEGVNTCSLIIVKCQNETSVTTMGVVFLTTTLQSPPIDKQLHEATHQMQFHNVYIRNR